MKSGASFSDCKKYRYSLWRIWDETRAKVMFIGLNPSTADEVNNDPTIRRCINFAKDWNYGGVIVVNLFAYRATKPEDLFAFGKPVGPDNDYWISRYSKEAELVIGAWGNDGTFLNRSAEIRQLIGQMKCLKQNKTGEPAHPLYQPNSSKPRDFIT